jgi:hypothetical protein
MQGLPLNHQRTAEYTGVVILLTPITVYHPPVYSAVSLYLTLLQI